MTENCRPSRLRKLGARSARRRSAASSARAAGSGRATARPPRAWLGAVGCGRIDGTLGRLANMIVFSGTLGATGASGASGALGCCRAALVLRTRIGQSRDVLLRPRGVGLQAQGFAVLGQRLAAQAAHARGSCPACCCTVGRRRLVVARPVRVGQAPGPQTPSRARRAPGRRAPRRSRPSKRQRVGVVVEARGRGRPAVGTPGRLEGAPPPTAPSPAPPGRPSSAGSRPSTDGQRWLRLGGPLRQRLAHGLRRRPRASAVVTSAAGPPTSTKPVRPFDEPAVAGRLASRRPWRPRRCRRQGQRRLAEGQTPTRLVFVLQPRPPLEQIRRPGTGPPARSQCVCVSIDVLLLPRKSSA